METIEYRTVDKSSWPRGPWNAEPDKRQWQDAATGLPCLIVRGPVGALCGYVGVSEGHPVFQKDEDSAEGVRVHGGLTFSGFCQHSDDESQHICHKPGPGEPDRVWWLGFDCSHCDDLMPKHGDSGIYRDIAYVTGECERLAQQLAELPSKTGGGGRA